MVCVCGLSVLAVSRHHMRCVWAVSPCCEPTVALQEEGQEDHHHDYDYSAQLDDSAVSLAEPRSYGNYGDEPDGWYGAAEPQEHFDNQAVTSPTEPQGSAVDVTISLTPQDDLLAQLAASRQQFEAQFSEDVRRSLTLSPEQVQLLSVSTDPTGAKAGPVVLTFRIRPERAAVALQQQIAAKKGPLRQGVITRYIDPTVLPVVKAVEQKGAWRGPVERGPGGWPESPHDALFTHADTNKDGVLDRQEFSALMKETYARP